MHSDVVCYVSSLAHKFKEKGRHGIKQNYHHPIPAGPSSLSSSTSKTQQMEC